MTKLVYALLCVCVNVAWAGTGQPPPTRMKVTILYTSCANGILRSCRCPDNPYGGLTQRAWAIQELRKKKENVIVLDSGDSFAPDNRRKDRVGMPYVRKILGLIPYHAIGIGDQEFTFGLDVLKETIKGSKAPFVCANIVETTTERPLAWPYVMVTVGRSPAVLRVAVIGLTHPKSFFFTPKERIAGVDVTDPDATLDEAMVKLKDKADLYVVLSHLGYDRDIELADSRPDIDVIVGGHSQTLLKEPEQVNDVIIVQPGKNGEHVGVLELEVEMTPADDGRPRIVSHCGELMALTEDVPELPEAKKLADEYAKETGVKPATTDKPSESRAAANDGGHQGRLTNDR